MPGLVPLLSQYTKVCRLQKHALFETFGWEVFGLQSRGFFINSNSQELPTRLVRER